MDDINFLALAAASFFFAATPGPGIVAVLATSISRGSAMGVAMSVGEVCGDMIYLLLAMVSLASLAQYMDDIMMVIRILGAGYLCWIGYQQMVSPPIKAEIAPVSSKGLSVSFATGVMISLTNPKVMVFYLSFLPLFIDLTTVTVETGIQIMLVMFFSVLGGPLLAVAIGKKARDFATGEKTGRWLNRVTGFLMIGVGIAMVATI